MYGLAIVIVFALLSCSACAAFDPSPHLVEAVVNTFFNATNSRDCKLLASIFAENCHIEDPRGTPAITSREELYNRCIQPTPFLTSRLSPHSNQFHVSSNGAAVAWTFFAAFENKCTASFSGIDVFTVAPENQRLVIKEMFGYFDLNEATLALSKCM
ncbi:hypothetical protein RCL1_007252 [Eukaryota sp. TZLM3-RCL]